MKQVLAQHIWQNANWQRWLRPVWQRPYPIAMKHYDWVRNEINKFLDAQGIHSSHSSWSTSNIVVPMQRVEDIFSKLMVLSTSQLSISALDIITYPSLKTLSPKHLLLENMIIWRFLLDLHRHQHTSKNSWIKYWRTYPLLLPSWMILLFTAKQQKNTMTIYSMFSRKFGMKNYLWNSASATFSPRKFNIWAMSSAVLV